MAVTTDSGLLQTRPAPIPALTGLRIVGAVWVMLFHFQATLYEAWPPLALLQPVIGVGAFGVPLFFVLSGYIIWHNYGFVSLLKPRAAAKFLWRRFARLWPVNVASQIIAIPVVWWGIVDQGNWGSPVPDWYTKLGWLQAAFMVQGVGHPDSVAPWNQPSWTLPAEMVAYVLFPLLLVIILAARIPRLRVTWPLVIVALLGAYLVRTDPWAFPYRWVVDLVLFFGVGVVLRLGGLPGPRLALVASVVQVAAPVAIVFACYQGYVDFVPSLLAAWVWSLCSTRGPGFWLFTRRGAQIAGQSSYSLYMLHWLIFGLGYIFLYYVPVVRESFLLLYVVVILAVVGAASWVSWKFYETPARRLLNRAFERVWRAKADSLEPVVDDTSLLPEGAHAVGEFDTPADETETEPEKIETR